MNIHDKSLLVKPKIMELSQVNGSITETSATITLWLERSLKTKQNDRK
jgi:hypothetical protein